ncbi:MAG: NAD-binding protein [Gemmataceae bacterium]|nr:NAD-binding protein [Gemmataceae bacterium]
MNRPVVLCGYGKVGRRVVECLLSDDLPVVVVSLEKPADLPDRVTFVAGDCRNRGVLSEAGVAAARGVIICTSNDLVNIAATLTVRSLSPDVRIVVRAFNPRLVPRLGSAVNNVVALSVSGLAAPLLSLLAQNGTAYGSFQVEAGLRTVHEITAADAAPVNALVPADAQLVAWLPESGKPRFHPEITGHETLAPGDRVVVCEKVSDTESVQWAPWFRRQWRAAVRTCREIETLVKVSLLVLLSVLALSTLVFHFVDDEPLADAFHHTVSVIATSGSLRSERYGPFLKWFESGLRLSGAALLAAFTAALTNYLIRARLGGAFEALRIPDRGHVVVCGLGNVGYRVVEELIRGRRPVVVLERSRENRFLTSARRLGAAVVVGDCTLPDALKQANVASARAVVVTTSDDLANLESALLVRELHPTQRIVVRLGESDLAETLRSSAGIRHAVAIPNLAAPAFAAALFGDRVQSVFLIAGRLLAAIEIHVEEGESELLGVSAGEMMKRFGMLLVSHQPAWSEGAAHKLAAGDRLTVIASLADLDRFYRRGA